MRDYAILAEGGKKGKREKKKERKELEAAEKNSDMSFGRHVGERLSKMTPYQKAIAQVKIQQVLLEVEFPSDQFHQQPIHQLSHSQPTSSHFPNPSNFNH